MIPPHPVVMPPRLGRTAATVAIVLAAGLATAWAGQNRSAPAPAPRAAAPAPHMGGLPGGGAPHLPGGMGGGGMGGGGMGMRAPGGFAAPGGGVHLPSGMAGGAHVPGGLPGGGAAHLPGGMATGAHVPGGFGGAAPHAPAGLVGRAPQGLVGRAPEGRFAPAHPGGAPFGGPAHEAGMHPGEHGGGGRELGGREAGGREGGPRFGGEAGAARGGAAHGFGDAGRHDPRIGGEGAGHTRGQEAGAAHHEARPYLRAEEHRDIGRDRAFAERHAGDFHTRDVRGFSAREMGAWRGGLWRREWHYGREGWWWDVDGVWYPYAEPVWPYPMEVAPIVVYEAAFVDGPAPTPIVAEGRPITIPPLPAAPAGRYRCDAPRGFYPSVATCSVPWELVADAPAVGLQSQD